MWYIGENAHCCMVQETTMCDDAHTYDMAHRRSGVAQVKAQGESIK